jgi:hypothetical protein
MCGKPLEAHELPVEISNDEIIVRALLTPQHVKNGTARRQALKPKATETAVSVIRQRMSTDFCKKKAQELAANIGPKMKPPNIYWGLLTLKAADIRSVGAEVTDSRDVYLGHADLDHQFPAIPQDDPVASAQQQKEIHDRIDALLAISKIHQDPSPLTEGWSAPALEAAHAPPAQESNEIA